MDVNEINDSEKEIVNQNLSALTSDMIAALEDDFCLGSNSQFRTDFFKLYCDSIFGKTNDTDLEYLEENINLLPNTTDRFGELKSVYELIKLSILGKFDMYYGITFETGEDSGKLNFAILHGVYKTLFVNYVTFVSDVISGYILSKNTDPKEVTPFIINEDFIIDLFTDENGFTSEEMIDMANKGDEGNIDYNILTDYNFICIDNDVFIAKMKKDLTRDDNSAILRSIINKLESNTAISKYLANPVED